MVCDNKSEKQTIIQFRLYSLRVIQNHKKEKNSVLGDTIHYFVNAGTQISPWNRKLEFYEMLLSHLYYWINVVIKITLERFSIERVVNPKQNNSKLFSTPNWKPLCNIVSFLTFTVPWLLQCWDDYKLGFQTELKYMFGRSGLPAIVDRHSSYWYERTQDFITQITKNKLVSYAASCDFLLIKAKSRSQCFF